MRFEWSPEKDAANRAKHGLRFSEVRVLLEGRADYLEIYDSAHSGEEDRYVAIGPISRGIVYVVFAERNEDTVRIISARFATPREVRLYQAYMRGRRP